MALGELAAALVGCQRRRGIQMAVGLQEGGGVLTSARWGCDSSGYTGEGEARRKRQLDLLAWENRKRREKKRGKKRKLGFFLGI